MDQGFDDLLNGAFSDVSVGFLENEDLDFENIHSDNNSEEEKTDLSQENPPTKEDEALHQEAIGAATASTTMENKDVFCSESVHEEQSHNKHNEEFSAGVLSTDESPQEDSTSSESEVEEESSDSEDDGVGEDFGPEEKPGDLLMSVHCDGFSYDDKEDELLAEGQPLAPQGSEIPDVTNEERGESEMSQELSYFGQVPEHVVMKGDGSEEDEHEFEVEAQENSSECEPVKIKQEDDFLSLSSEQEIENPHKAGASLEISEVQDLIVEDDAEECEAKMKDFSGEEHQEAGESFADYPSDFSSCEYVEGGGKNLEKDHKENTVHGLERAGTDVTWTGGEKDSDQEGEGGLYSKVLEVDAHGEMNLEVASEENRRTEEIEHGSDDEDQDSESDSYSSSDDDEVRRDEERSYKTRLQDLESYKTLEGTQLYSENGAAFPESRVSDDHRFTNNQVDVADFNINWDFNFTSLLCEDLLSAVDTGSEEMQPAGSNLHPAEDTNSYSVVQREDRKATSTSYQGSLDDGFFNTDLEASGASERGQLADDEYEEERNWEQEKERIEAFYKFYDDDVEENGREERQIKVQFCADPLSQVIHYETDSSDRDSLSSSTESEEDLSSTETSEEPKEPEVTLQTEPAFDPPVTEKPNIKQENDVINTQICTRKHKCGGILKQVLKMGLVLLTGTLMFWLATDQADWLGQISFF